MKLKEWLMIKLIAAVSKNNIIGINNKIPWYYPNELRFFKEKTINSNVIMGRKTFESVGVLKNRNIVVITKSEIPGLKTFDSLEKAIEYCNNDVWIAGGYNIYKSSFKFCKEIYISNIPKVIEHNSNDDVVYFPFFNKNEFITEKLKEVLLEKDNIEVFKYTRTKCL